MTSNTAGVVEQFIIKNYKLFIGGLDSIALKDFYDHGCFKGMKFPDVLKLIHRYCYVYEENINGQRIETYAVKYSYQPDVLQVICDAQQKK